MNGNGNIGRDADATTGDAVLDFMLEAGPRTFTEELATPERRFAIAKTTALGPYLEAVKDLAQHQVALIHREIERVSIENRTIDWKSAGTHAPYFRVPALLYDFFECIYGTGCWRDKDFVEDTLKHHPGLRVIVKRDSKGQEYVNGRGR